MFPLEPLKDKYEALNWHVIEVDGHNIRQIIAACKEAKAIYEKPTAILCHTIPGKGVSYMENNYEWHGKAPTKEQGDVAFEQLKAEEDRIKGEIANYKSTRSSC
ncbi:MAG: hypothetical protein ACYC56_07950 [Candidatus Aquicultor sp.]